MATNDKKKADRLDNELKELKRWREENNGPVSLVADNVINISTMEPIVNDMMLSDQEYIDNLFKQYILDDVDDDEIESSVNLDDELSQRFIKKPRNLKGLKFTQFSCVDPVNWTSLPEDWTKSHLGLNNNYNFTKKIDSKITIEVNESNQLKESLPKRKRMSRKYKSLFIKVGDFRIALVSNYIDLQNSHNYEGIKKLLQDHFAEQFVFKYEVVSPGETKLLPKKVELRGIDNFLTFITAVNNAVPDMITILDTLMIKNYIKNKSRNSSIHTSQLFDGTAIFEIHLKNENLYNKYELYKAAKKLAKKSETQLSDSLNSINLTDLSNDLEKVDLLDQLDTTYEFKTGNLIKKFTIEGVIDSVFYLDENDEVYMMECKVSLVDQEEE